MIRLCLVFMCVMRFAQAQSSAEFFNDSLMQDVWLEVASIGRAGSCIFARNCEGASISTSLSFGVGKRT